MADNEGTPRLHDLLPEPIDDVLVVAPFAGAEDEGIHTLSLDYRCYERSGERCAWTRHPDGSGRHHGLLLRMSRRGWTVVADEEFGSEETARAWAARLWAIGRGLTAADLL